MYIEIILGHTHKNLKILSKYANLKEIGRNRISNNREKGIIIVACNIYRDKQ